MDTTAAFVGAFALVSAYEYAGGRQTWWESGGVRHGPTYAISEADVGTDLEGTTPDNADAVVVFLASTAAAALATAAAKQIAPFLVIPLTVIAAGASAATAVLAVVILVDVKESLPDPTITAAGVVHGIGGFVIASAALFVSASLDLKKPTTAEPMAVASMAVSGLMFASASSYHLGYIFWFRDGDEYIGPLYTMNTTSDRIEACSETETGSALLVLLYANAVTAAAVGVLDTRATRAAAAAAGVALAITSALALGDTAVGTLERYDGIFVLTLVPLAYAVALGGARRESVEFRI